MKRARPKEKKHLTKKSKVKQEQYSSQPYGYSSHTDYSEIIDEIREEKTTAPNRRRKPQKPKKQKKNVKKVLPILLIALLLLVIVAMGLNLFDDSDILAPIEDGKINVLMLGVDESGLRTDAIMVASYDVNEGKVNLLSVPRDTKIRITNKGITRKINAVHAMTSDNEKGKILGAQATAEAVTQLTGIPINYYIEFSFLAIDHLFDSLGGVEYDIPDVEGGGRGMNYDDPYQNLHIHLKPGMQTLDGSQVQQFLRYRKSNYGVGSGSDIDRVKRQQEFLRAVVNQKMNFTALKKIPGIYSKISKEVKTNISTGDMTKYIRYLNKITEENINSYNLPGVNKMIGGASYFVCDLDATKALVNDNFGIDAPVTDQITLSGKNPQKPIIAGNMTKPAQEQAGEAAVEKEPAAKSEKTEKKAKEEPSEPVKEEKADEAEEADKPEEENSPETPPVEPNKTPLEDIYSLDE